MPSDGAWRAQRLRFTVLSAALVLVAFVATAVVRNIFLAAHQPIGWAVSSGLVAVLLFPVIGRLSRAMPRGVAIALTMLAVLVLVTTVAAGLYTDLRAQVARLVDALPAAAAGLERDGAVGGIARDLRLEDRVTSFVDDLEERYSQRSTLEGTAVTVPAYFVSGILVVFFVVWGPQMYEGALRQVADADRRTRSRHVVSAAVRLGRRYSWQRSPRRW